MFGVRERTLNKVDRRKKFSKVKFVVKVASARAILLSCAITNQESSIQFEVQVPVGSEQSLEVLVWG